MGRTGRRPKPARIWIRPDDGRWLILDRGKQIPTGARNIAGKEDAQEALERYLAKKHFDLPASPQPLSLVQIETVLAHYLQKRGEKFQDPQRQAYAVIALSEYWHGKCCADITDDSCEAYAKTRTSAATARRELGVLRAALRLARRDKLIDAAPEVLLPEVKKRQPATLDRSECAKVLWQLRSKKRTRHAARMMLCMLYTGSRPGTISRTTWVETDDNPWIDLKEGIWHRSGAGENETKKRRRPHKIPRRLHLHLRIWRDAMARRAAQGEGRMPTYVIEHARSPGKPVMDIGGSLQTACKEAGVRTITPHGLKHTAITNALRSGMSIEEAADYFSTSVKTIQDTYWEKSPRYQERQAGIMDRFGKPQ